MSDQYDEFLTRQSWRPGDYLQLGLSNRTLHTILRHTKINHQQCQISEFGPGTGTFAVACESLGVTEYIGFEPNKNLAKNVQSRMTTGKIILASLPNIPANYDAYFDISVAIHVLEHSSGPYDARLWLVEAMRVTKKNGYIVIISPDIKSYGSYFWDIDWTHSFPTTTERICQIGNDIGLEIFARKTLRAGSTSVFVRSLAQVMSVLLPTRLINHIGQLLLGRQLGTGVQSALLWANTFVVFKKV